MRASTIHKTPASNHTYSASVPLAAYRKLAAELQAAEARLDSLNAENQQLATENQQLRQEIEKAVQSVLHLQQSVESASVGSRKYAYNPNKNFQAGPNHLGSELRPTPRSFRSPTAIKSVVEGSSFLPIREANSVAAEKVFTEQEEGRYRRRSQLESASEIRGRSLVIAILLIMVTAFGAGYLLMRPLLHQSR